MIRFEDYPILKSHLSTLKETSVDFHDQTNIQYMTASEMDAVNFDEVKEEYIRDLSLVEAPKSNDALFILKNGTLVFVEFKNGYMDKVKEYGVRKKIYDSIIILTDILGCGVASLRQNMEYILVYNESANEDQHEVIEKKKFMVQSSRAYDNLAKNIFQMARREYVCFGVNIFKNYCFKDVHTYTEKEFEEYLEKNKNL